MALAQMASSGLGHGGLRPRRARRVLGDDLVEEVGQVLAVMGRAAGEDLEEDGPEPVDVRAAVDQVVTAFRLFRGHVGGRADLADRRRRLRVPGEADVEDRRLGFLRRLVDHLRQAPVEDDDLAEVPQHDVLRLQVAVDHSPRMPAYRSPGRPRRRCRATSGARGGPRPSGAATVVLGDRAAEGPPSDEPHRIEGLIVRLATRKLIDRYDVGVLELAGDLSFLEEPAPRVGLRCMRGLNFLQRDVAIEVDVVHHPDLAQSPFGMEPGQRVARPLLFGRRGQGGDQHVARSGGKASERPAETRDRRPSE